MNPLQGLNTISNQEKDSTSRGMRPIFLFLMGTIILIGLTITIMNPFLESGTSAAKDELSFEYQKIIHPPTAIPDGQLEIHTKKGAVLFIQRFTTKVPYEELINYYRHTLNNNGWVSGRGFGSEPRIGKAFCKGPYLASTEILDIYKDGSIIYSFSMSWSEISKTECQKIEQ